MTDDSPQLSPPSPPWWQGGLARLLLGLALFAVMGAAVWIALRWDQSSSKHPISPTLEPKAVAVAEGVFLLGKLSPSVAYAVETSDGLVLIDTGLEASARPLLDQLDSLGLKVDRLRAILLTHAHGDHTLGAARLRELTGARIHAGKADCKPLRDGGPREAFFSTFPMVGIEPHRTTIDVELEGDETLTFGDTKFTALATPGHTPGSICYLLERRGQRILFSGDVVQSLSQASTGALGTYAASLPPLYRGNARDYLATLRKLEEMPAPDLVLPGHPHMDSPPQSPRLAEQRWRKLLAGGVAEMERLLARFDSDGANFLDGQPKQLRPGLHYLGNHAQAALYAVETPKGLIVFDASGDEAASKALPARLAKAGLAGKQLAAVFLTSADKDASGGLVALLGSHSCKVVVGKDGLDAVRKLCPPKTVVFAAEDLLGDGKGELAELPELKVIPLAGRGIAPVAYQFRWAGKSILVSGRIPSRPGGTSSDAVVRAVGGDVEGYFQSLTRLSQVRPDLWLPAVPVQGQNANLYEREWEKMLAANRALFRR